jgi:hypothetical protein
MFQFGTTEDVRKLWELPLDDRAIPVSEIWKDAPATVNVSRAKIGETYIWISYMEKIGRDLHYNYEDHYRLLREDLVVIDKESLDLYWHKYGFGEYRVCADPKYKAGRVHAKFGHREWLALLHEERKLNLTSSMLSAPECVE